MWRQIEALFAAENEPWPATCVSTNSVTALQIAGDAQRQRVGVVDAAGEARMRGRVSEGRAAARLRISRGRSACGGREILELMPADADGFVEILRRVAVEDQAERLAKRMVRSNAHRATQR
jgi:hypothetical protein